MSKLGYTFYPKDWSSSESVFELNLIERGFYRELIDLAMTNDNMIEVKSKVWARKFNSNEDEISSLLERLKSLDLIFFDAGFLTVPSCENRLNLIRGGQKGGLKSKPIPKPTMKPTIKPFGTKEKEKEKEKEKSIRPSLSEVINFFISNNYSESSAKIAFETYDNLDWIDTHGNPIKNWEFKMKKVWFKDENKEFISKGYSPQIPN